MVSHKVMLCYTHIFITYNSYDHYSFYIHRRGKWTQWLKNRRKIKYKKMVFLQQKPIKICVLKQLSNDKRNTKTKKLINVRDMIHNDK